MGKDKSRFRCPDAVEQKILDEQRGRRLPLLANNARLLGLPGREAPNLMSRFMSGMLGRLSADWQESWGHPVAVEETFVDPILCQGTCYKVSGWMHGQRDLAAFGRALSRAQMRALKFRMVPRSRQREAPGETTLMRVPAGVDAAQVERALPLWQDQMLGAAQDPLIAVDGKKLRHAGGTELVSTFGVKSGRWMGSVCTATKSNEIPAARELLAKIDVNGETVVFDALHTQRETARTVVIEGGGDYVFTVKGNQQDLDKEVDRLLEGQPFSPS